MPTKDQGTCDEAHNLVFQLHLWIAASVWVQPWNGHSRPRTDKRKHIRGNGHHFVLWHQVVTVDMVEEIPGSVAIQYGSPVQLQYCFFTKHN